MGKLLNTDFVTALVLFGVSALFSVGSSADPKDWAFPLLANYVVLGIAIAFLVRAVFASLGKRSAELIRVSPEHWAAFRTVLVFLVIVLAYMFVMFGLGFWLSSLLMLTLASLYLTLERTRRNVGLAIIVPVCICVAAFVVFTHVFYVPFPAASWFEAG